MSARTAVSNHGDLTGEVEVDEPQVAGAVGVSKASKPSPRRPWVIGGGAALALAASGVVLSLNESTSELPAAAVASDVPTTDGHRIVFSDAFTQRIGLKWAQAREAPLVPLVSVVGTVTFDPEHVAAVGTRLRGLVQRVHAHEGDQVERGQVLAEIDSAELGEAQAAVTMYRAQRQAAERNSQREAELASRNLTTAREAEVAGAQLDETTALLRAAEQKVQALGGALPTGENSRLGVYVVRSPLSGTVIERHVAPGQSVEGHLVAFRVTNMDRVWVELAVFEQTLGGIHMDDPVVIRSISDPDAAINGRVANIGASIDPDSRSAAVRVEVDNSARALRIGQAVTAQIQSVGGAAAKSTLIPNSAITFVDGKAVVFVAEGDNAVVVRPVELGQTDGTERQVRTGIQPGERVVSDGVFALKSELFR